jgi:O-antigen biosynthesis protein WbqP
MSPVAGDSDKSQKDQLLFSVFDYVDFKLAFSIFFPQGYRAHHGLKCGRERCKGGGQTQNMVYRDFFRPAADRIIAAIALTILSPVMVLTAAAILLDDGRPVLFRQRRNGAGNTPFIILKFRSMPAGTPQLASADARQLELTRTGRIIRRLNIDELPQLFNVLKGDMALIGPRPPLLTQADVISLRTGSGAHILKPGITGLAQINGRDGMGVDEKCRLDEIYAQRMGLGLDLKILLGTAAYLFRNQPVV